jgi:hypothetical protein
MTGYCPAVNRGGAQSSALTNRKSPMQTCSKLFAETPTYGVFGKLKNDLKYNV